VTFATSVPKISITEEAMCLYEKASGGRLNPLKSKAIAIGWSSFDTVLGIPYHSHVKTLGFTFWNSTDKSITDMGTTHCTSVVTSKRRLPRKIVWPTHTYLFAKIWYIAQIFPPQASTPNN
jgi:hypothetical protein